MTKAPLGGEKFGPSPTDRGKGGAKRSLLTDGHGIRLAIIIDGANRHDMKLARPTLEPLETERPSLLAVWQQGLCMDKGYDYPQTWQLAVDLAIGLTFARVVKKSRNAKLGSAHAAG